MIEEGLFQFLKTNDEIDAVLPSENGIFMGFVPEEAKYPCVMFEKVSGVHDTTLDGPSGYVIRRYQFTCYGKDTQNAPGSGYILAQQLADVIRQQMNGLTGTLPDGTLLFNMILDNELDSYDADSQTYHAVQDYFVHFEQNP